MKRLLLAGLALGACRPSGPTEHYGFIARLGRDTVSVENVTRTGNRVTSDEVDRFPRVRQRHTEIELAFTTMFGTFGPAFFEAYEALLPLEPGFHELRSGLYKLYPTLVHVRLFGSAYVPPIERTLAHLGL